MESQGLNIVKVGMRINEALSNLKYQSMSATLTVSTRIHAFDRNSNTSGYVGKSQRYAHKFKDEYLRSGYTTTPGEPISHLREPSIHFSTKSSSSTCSSL